MPCRAAVATLQLVYCVLVVCSLCRATAQLGDARYDQVTKASVKHTHTHTEMYSQ